VFGESLSVIAFTHCINKAIYAEEMMMPSRLWRSS